MEIDQSPKLLYRIENVTKRYRMGRRRIDVLKDVSFEIQRGEFLALSGSSGAGKSTLLHLLAGLDLASEGKIFLDGIDLALHTDGQLAKLRNSKVGFVFQSYNLFPDLDALENVCLPARMARRAANVVEKQGRKLLKAVGLGARIDHRPVELSGGEQQRVSIARALINDPELILADEPTGNLDSKTGDDIVALLAELRAEKGITMVVATHDPKVAAAAPRIIELEDGRMLHDLDRRSDLEAEG